MVRIKLFHLTLLVASLMLLLALGSLAAARAVEGGQQGLADDQKYAGTWTGTYSSEGGDTEKVTITLSKDEKGHWRGTIKYIDQDGEQTAELKSLQISGGKFKAKIESTDASAEITLEGEFQGTRFEGTYSVSEKGSTEIAEKGIWKTARSSAPKTER